MEILIVLFILGFFLFFIKNAPKESNRENYKYKNQGEDTWDKWTEGTKNYEKYQGFDQDKLETKTLPDGYYQSEEYKKFCEERTKKYNELVKEGKAGEPQKDGKGIATGYINREEEQVFYGERGGRYRYRYNRNGQPYRDYF